MVARDPSLINAATRFIKGCHKDFEKNTIPKGLFEQIAEYYSRYHEDFTWKSGKTEYSLSTVLSSGRVRFNELEMTKFSQFKDICSLELLGNHGIHFQDLQFDDFVFMALFERHGWASEHDQEMTDLLKEEKIAKLVKNIKDVAILSSDNECQRLFIKNFMKNTTNYQKYLSNGHFTVLIQSNAELALCLLEVLFRDLENRHVHAERLSAELIVDIIRIFKGSSVKMPNSTDPYRNCVQSAFFGDISRLLEVFADFDQTQSWPENYTYFMEELLLTCLSTTKQEPIWQSIRQTVTSDPKTFAKCLRLFDVYDHRRHCQGRAYDYFSTIFQGLHDSIDLPHLVSINKKFAIYLAEGDNSFLIAICERLTAAQLEDGFFGFELEHRACKKIYDHSRQLFHSLLRQGAFGIYASIVGNRYHCFRPKPDDTNMDYVMKQIHKCEVNRSMVMQCMIMGLIPEITREDFIRQVENIHGEDIPEYPEALKYLLSNECSAPKKAKIARKKKKS